MKKALCGLIAMLMCVSAAGCEKNMGEVQTVTCLAEPAAAEETVQPDYTVEEISGYFNYAMLKEIVDRQQNTVASPLSVKLALNMAAMGAEEDTEKELLTLFGYESAEQMQEDSRILVSELDRADGSITVNNSVWIDKNYPIGEKYTAGLIDVFNAETFREKLSDEKTVDKLNGWIDEKTNGLIHEMISEPFDEDTVLLLVNALYFKNEWVCEFEGQSPITFHGLKGDTEIKGMYLEYDGIEYGENKAFRSVSLEYKDGSRMNIYLPKSETENVLDIIADSSPDGLAADMDIEYENKLVRIHMPKFECEYSESLKDTLQKLGMTVSFDPNRADFGGMSDMDTFDPLYVSDVIHAAKLTCNEKGTEAAALTIVEVVCGAAAPAETPIEFIADRPFIYEIKAPSGETLFLGTICGF